MQFCWIETHGYAYNMLYCSDFENFSSKSVYLIYELGDAIFCFLEFQRIEIKIQYTQQLNASDSQIFSEKLFTVTYEKSTATFEFKSKKKLSMAFMKDVAFAYFFRHI